MACLQLANFKFAILKTKESHVWFLSDAKYAKSITDNWVIEKSACNSKDSGIENQTGFSSSEIVTICESLESSILDNFVKEAIKAQKNIGIFVGIVAFIWMLWGLFQTGAITATHKIIAKIKEKND
jgi:hypothetical protein